MQLHKPVMTFTASSPPAFRSSMGIPSHPADFRLYMSERLLHFYLHHLRFVLIYVFVEGVRCGWVPSVQFFCVLLPYLFHLLPLRYHLPRAQLHGSTSCTVGSCYLFDLSEQVSRSSHFIAFFNLPTFLHQALFLILSCSPLESCIRSSVVFVISFASHISPFVCDLHRFVR